MRQCWKRQCRWQTFPSFLKNVMEGSSTCVLSAQLLWNDSMGIFLIITIHLVICSYNPFLLRRYLIKHHHLILPVRNLQVYTQPRSKNQPIWPQAGPFSRHNSALTSRIHLESKSIKTAAGSLAGKAELSELALLGHSPRASSQMASALSSTHPSLWDCVFPLFHYSLCG